MASPFRNGGRIRTHHQDEARARIQVSQLLNRLQDHLDGKVRLDALKVRVIELLLRKTLPDLSSVEQTGEQQKPVVIVTGVPRPWDKPIDDSSSLQPNDSVINNLADTKGLTEH